MAKRPKTWLVRAVCRNCGAATVGRYCHLCGQDLLAGSNHRLREIVSDTLGNLFALDGKIMTTLRYLVARPGRLTSEFYDGRIVRYVFPSKLFWFITLVFFAVLWSVTTVGGEEAIEVAKESAKEDSLLTSGEALKFLQSWSPYMVLALVPIFALLVRMSYPRRERTYSDYLVFSLHFNSFVFLASTMAVVVDKFWEGLEAWTWLIMLMLPVYLGLSLRNVFGARWGPMIFKLMLMGLMYFVLMLTVLAVSLMVFIVFIKKIDIFAGN